MSRSFDPLILPLLRETLTHVIVAEAVSEFINSMLDCPLPIDGLAILVDFLGLPNATSKAHRGLGRELPETDDYGESLNSAIDEARDPFALSAASDTQLVRAENKALLAGRLAGSSSNAALPAVNSIVNQNELSQPVSHQFREAMYSALMTVMEERDEAHARMVATTVLHVHEMEQQRKAMRRLSEEFDTFKRQRGSEPSAEHGRKQSRAEKQMQQDSEAELLSLCQQLASEISARTSASLEIVRLKESREAERANEAAERQSLEDELRRTQELLALERSKVERSRKESLRWMQSYEEVVQDGEFEHAPRE